MSDQVTLTIDGVEVSVPKGTLIVEAAKQIENEILYGFDSLPLQDKRKIINVLSRRFPTIKDRIKELLSQRKTKPKRLNYSSLNSKECAMIYKEFKFWP